MSNGWVESAGAWIEDMGERGDYGCEFVLDGPMMERVRAKRFRAALDVGCGEGRFCRMMQGCGIRTVGVDPTEALIARAREMDAEGDYRLGRAEALEVADGSFDLVVSYLTLIDIPELDKAIGEMARVLEPGGTLLIANINSFNTAGTWTREANGERRFVMDHYMTERVEWMSWRGIRIQNWHRPLSRYMELLLGQGLVLRHYGEPEPSGGDEAKSARYRRAPYFMVMEWERPA